MNTALGYKVSGEVFTNELIPAQPEIIRDARVFQLFGVDMLTSVKNWTGRANMSVIGSPVYSPGHASLDGNDGFESADAASNGAFTYLAVSTGNIGSTANLGIIGRWQSGAAQDMLYYYNNNSVAVAVDGALRASRVIPGTIPALKFVSRLMGGRFNGTTARALYSDAGVISFTDAAYAGGAAASAKLRVGATGFPTSATPNADVTAAIAWNKAISDQEIEACYRYLKGLITSRGGSVA